MKIFKLLPKISGCIEVSGPINLSFFLIQLIFNASLGGYSDVGDSFEILVTYSNAKNRSPTSSTFVTNIDVGATWADKWFRMQNQVKMMKVPKRRSLAKVKFLMMDKIIPDLLKPLNCRIDFYDSFFDSSYWFTHDYAEWVINYDNIKTTIIYSLTFARGQVKNQLKKAEAQAAKIDQLKTINKNRQRADIQARIDAKRKKNGLS